MPPQKIFLSGVTGSGKTTLARAISDKTGLPLINVDELTWLPGWVEVPSNEQRAIFDGLTREPRWVMDTAYGRWKDIPEGRADLILCLDYPRHLSFLRLLRRSFQRAVSKEPICNGNIETFRKLLSHESILLWHFRSFASKRRRARAWLADPTKAVIVFRHPREAEQWLETLTPEGEQTNTAP